MRQPLVSVVIPNYNHARFLSRRIDSVLNQSYSNIEVIILDDASKDNSLEVIKHYLNKDERIRFFPNQENSGSTFMQWNKGLSLAKGEYIWLAESDDFAEVDFLYKCINIAITQPEVGLIYCQSWMVDDNNQVFGSCISLIENIDKERWNYSFINDGKAELKEYFSLVNTIPNASAAIFRKDLVGELFEELEFKLVGDKVFWAKLLKLTNIAYIHDHLNHFRFHVQSVRSTNQEESVLIENIKWYNYLFSNIEVPEKNRRLILNKLLMTWLGVMHKRGIGKKDLKILQSMKAIDPYIIYRVTYRFVKDSLNRLLLSQQR